MTTVSELPERFHSRHLLFFLPLWWAMAALTAVAAFIAALPAAGQKVMEESEISAAVMREFAKDSAVPEEQIEATTLQGIVTLRGEVDNILATERAEYIAGTIEGVRAVVNLVELKPVLGLLSKHLQQSIQNALQQNSVAGQFDVHVVASDTGKVILTGDLDSWQQKVLCTEVVKGVRGVTSVDDSRVNLNAPVAGSRGDDELAEQIKTRLKWDVLVEDSSIQVDVERGNAVLTGTVRSAAEKKRAIEDARSVAWITDVDASGLELEGGSSLEAAGKEMAKPPTNDDILAALNDALQQDPRIISDKVKITLSGEGVVSITGAVANVQAKNAVTQLAHNTVGVTRVDNQLNVRSGDNSITDGAIHKSVAKRLTLDPALAGTEITATVTGGVVTLNGQVTTFYHKARAGVAPSGAHGVKSVENKLTVTDPSSNAPPSPYASSHERSYQNPDGSANFSSVKRPPAGYLQWRDDQELKGRIDAELFWSALVDEKHITVEVKDGRARLLGSVDGPRQKEAALQMAKDAGAVFVDNLLVAELP